MTIGTPVTSGGAGTARIGAVPALLQAIDTFPTQAAFLRALQFQIGVRHNVTSAHLSNWIKRCTGAPAYIAPDIEAISGVKCEELCPDVSWHVLRGKRPSRRRRARKKLSQDTP